MPRPNLISGSDAAIFAWRIVFDASSAVAMPLKADIRGGAAKRRFGPDSDIGRLADRAIVGAPERLIDSGIGAIVHDPHFIRS